MKSLANNILNTIDTQEIRPIPKWVFLLVYGVGVLLLILLFVLSTGLSAFFWQVASDNIYQVRHFGMSGPGIVSQMLSWLWLSVFSAIVGLFLFVFQKIGKLYRVSAIVVVIATLAVSIASGYYVQSRDMTREYIHTISPHMGHKIPPEKRELFEKKKQCRQAENPRACMENLEREFLETIEKRKVLE